MKRSRRKAFTLVEMLVVIGITSVLAAVAIGYSHVGENENALTVETAKVGELVLQARQLALATYGGSANVCAYGVKFSYTGKTGTYSLFAYTPPLTKSGRCPAAASSTVYGVGNSSYIQKYEDSSWNIVPTQGAKLVGPGSARPPACPASKGNIVDAIVFYPPNPVTYVSYDGTSLSNPAASSIICLETVDGQNSSVITLNPIGQVSF